MKGISEESVNLWILVESTNLIVKISCSQLAHDKAQSDCDLHRNTIHRTRDVYECKRVGKETRSSEFIQHGLPLSLHNLITIAPCVIRSEKSMRIHTCTIDLGLTFLQSIEVCIVSCTQLLLESLSVKEVSLGRNGR